MKKSSLRSIFSRLSAAVADRANRASNAASRATRLRLEALEAREMLAVGAAEYAAILQAYPEFELPQNYSQVNIIEIQADEISLNALKDAIETAGATKKDDLVVVRTDAQHDRVALEKPSDQLVYELDPDFFGATTIVAVGSKPLTLDAQAASRVLTLAAGKLSLGNLVLANGAGERGGLVYNRGDLTLKDCALTSGAATSGLGSNVYSSGALSAVNSTFNNALSGVSVYSVGALSLDGCAIDSNAGAGLYVESDASTTLKNTSISHNAEYGAQNLYGVLEMTAVTIDANGSYGLINSGGTKIVESTISNNASAGIYNRSFATSANISATLTVARTLFSGNAFANGGAIYNEAGALNISNSVFSGNTAQTRGGAIYCAYRPGFANQATVVNSTIAGNVAGEQGGGVYVENSFGFALYNSIVSMNYAGDVGINVVGDVASRNNLLDQSALFVVAPIFDYAQGKLANAGKLDLRLAKNSPAINIGDNSRVAAGALDFAGKARVYGRAVDAGAYEYSGTGETSRTPVYVVDTLADSFDLDDGKTSLREAIYFAVNNDAAITFKTGLEGTIKLNAQLVVSTTLLIDGNDRITIDAGGASRAFLVENDLELRDLTIVNAQSATNGGAIYASSPLTLDNVVVSGVACGDGYNGAAVYSTSDFHAVNSTFEDSARGDLLRLLGSAALSRCVISNSVDDGIYASGTLYVSETTVSQVERGVVNDYGSVTLVDARVYDNRSYGVDNIGSLSLLRSVVENNADSGIYNRSVVVSDGRLYTSTVEATNTIVRRNASEYGAGIYNLYGRVELTNCELSANVASKSGGAYYCATNEFGANAGIFHNVTVAGNVAQNVGGGVALADSNALLLLYNTIVAQNLAGNLDSNVSGEIALSTGSRVGGNPGFVVAPLYDFTNKKLTNRDALDLRLAENSALIDKGVNDAVEKTNTVDLAGNTRVYVKLVDPGAYEYHGTGEQAVTPTYRVTSLADTFDPNDGKTTLREALYWAAQDGATITFSSSLSGTIKLNSQLVSTANVTIEGNGAVTISGQSKTRVLLNEGALTLKNITLTSGKSSTLGVNVYNSGTLTLDGATITAGTTTSQDNASVYSVGALNVYDSTISNASNASGVASFGALVMRDSVVDNNAKYGVYVAATASIASSTISSNADAGVYNRYGVLDAKNVTFAENKNSGLINLGSSTLSGCSVINNVGSGLVNLSEVYTETSRYSATLKVYVSTLKGNRVTGDGGAVYNYGGLLEIDNSELSGNVATGNGGGVYNVANGACLNKTTLINCTIAGNSANLQGGGVYVDSQRFTLAMYNTIVARNYSSSTNVDGPVAFSVKNLTSGNPSFIAGPVFDERGVLQNADALNLRLAKQSVAIDSGSNARVAGSVDLDGKDRVFNAVVDIGAYEYAAPASIVVDTLDDSFDLNDDVTSLREALYWVQDGGAIAFLTGLKGTISLTSTLSIDKNIAIVGNGFVTLSGGNAIQILATSAKVSIENLAFADGYATTLGGAIANTGVLSIANCVFKTNAASNGGAIYNRAGTLSIKNSTFADNSASVNGGAIYNVGTLSVMTSTFTRNTAHGSGGAIYDSGSATIVNALLADSTASVSGGAIYKSSGTLCVVNSTIAQNAAQLGGGIYVSDGSTSLYNDVFALNTSDYSGSTKKLDARYTLATEPFAGEGCVAYDAEKPLFVDAANGNYALTGDSQATDLGSSELARAFGLGLYAVDRANTPRVIGDAIDLGAYENRNAADVVVQENAQTTLSVTASATDKVYWDLSGTGAGEYVLGASSFTLDAANYAPGYHLLRYKVVTSKGAVKTEKTLSLHVTATPPLVDAERVDFGDPHFVVYTVDARYLAAYPQGSWRVTWGDGSSSLFTDSAFVAAKYYDDLTPGYTVELTLVGEDGLDEFTCQLGLVK